MALTINKQLVIAKTNGLASLPSVYVRAFSYIIRDNKESETTIKGQFAFYQNKSNWLEDDIENIIKIEGFESTDYNFAITYNRSIHGVDIMLYVYTKLIELLMAKIPSLTIEDIAFDLADPS